ncbi:hypothetical protein ZWY2020_053162 [Hordeum vulgare]|nr:hypothetical protein ZWY2020_053162 [Hordeum vulgare]
MDVVLLLCSFYVRGCTDGVCDSSMNGCGLILQRVVPHVGKSVYMLAEKWREIAVADDTGVAEVDVAERFQEVTEEAITRATFGDIYNDGRVVLSCRANSGNCYIGLLRLAHRRQARLMRPLRMARGRRARRMMRLQP